MARLYIDLFILGVKCIIVENRAMYLLRSVRFRIFYNSVVLYGKITSTWGLSASFCR